MRKYIVLIILIISVIGSPACQQMREAPEPEPKKIVVYGDTRTHQDIHQRIVDTFMQLEPIAVFHTGDLVANGHNSQQWELFNRVTADMRSKTEFYPALGNHEGNSKLYFDNFQLPNNERWYSVRKNNIHFIILDTNTSLKPDSEQYQWLIQDLKSIGPDIKFTVGIFHHPPFSTGKHPQDVKGLRSTILPLFEQYGVDVVFSGHDHNYERSLYNGIYYIVAGGGGAPLYKQKKSSPYSQVFFSTYHFCVLTIQDDRLNVEVLGEDMAVLDKFAIQGNNENSK
jgi:acid phosphatase type 7